MREGAAYMASLVSDGSGGHAAGVIPYVIDCLAPDWDTWPLDTITYVTEGVAAAWQHAPRMARAREFRRALIAEFEPTVGFLLASQNDDGSWGSTAHAADRQRRRAPAMPPQPPAPPPSRFAACRSPRVATLLNLAHVAAAATGGAPDPKLAAALARYAQFLLDSGRTKEYGVEHELRTSGFAGCRCDPNLAVPRCCPRRSRGTRPAVPPSSPARSGRRSRSARHAPVGRHVRP